MVRQAAWTGQRWPDYQEYRLDRALFPVRRRRADAASVDPAELDVVAPVPASDALARGVCGPPLP